MTEETKSEETTEAPRSDETPRGEQAPDIGKPLMLGRKLGMLQHFRPDGSAVAAPAIAPPPNARPRVQGPPDGRASGCRADHGEEPRDPPGRCRPQPPRHRGRRPRRAQRHRHGEEGLMADKKTTAAKKTVAKKATPVKAEKAAP